MMSKQVILRIISFATITLGGLFFSITTASAALPNGDACWIATTTQSNRPKNINKTTLIKLHLVQLDSSQKSVHGQATVPNDNPVFLSGTAATLASGAIRINLTGTQAHRDNGWLDESVARINLNPNTLNGSFYGIGTSFKVLTQQFGSDFSSGTFTKTACP